MKYLKTVAIFFFVIAGLGLLSAGLVSFAALRTYSLQIWSMIGAVAILGVYFVVLGAGLLKKKRWAWWLAFATMVIEVPLGLMNVFTRFSLWEVVRLLVAVSLVVLLFLGRNVVLETKPKVETEELPQFSEAPAVGGKLKRR